MSDVKGMYIGGSPTYFKDETAREFISDIYDETKTYTVDSYCIHENKLYKCTTETTGGFDGSCWKETNMTTEAAELSAAVSEQNKNFATPTLLTTVTSFTHGEWKAISGISSWKDYKELTFIGAGQLDSSGSDIIGAISTINTELISTNMVINLFPYASESASYELKVKFLSTGKINVTVYEKGDCSVKSLKIYGK